MARITVNAPGWEVQSAARGGPGRGWRIAPGTPCRVPHRRLHGRGRSRDPAAAGRARRRRRRPDRIDLTCDLAPGEAAVLVVRRPSGALTFHTPDETVRRTRGGAGSVHFTVPPPAPPPTGASRGILTQAIKAIVVKVKDAVIDAAVGAALPLLARAFETHTWKQKGLAEGWLKVTQAALKAKNLPGQADFHRAFAAVRPRHVLERGRGVRLAGGLRLLHARRAALRRSHLRLRSLHPEPHAGRERPDAARGATRQDVHLRRHHALARRAGAAQPGRAGQVVRAARATLSRRQVVLVASPNEGTPLATPRRWEDTVGWVANLLELFPDNPFTTGAAFVANGIVWIASTSRAICLACTRWTATAT